MLWVKMFSNYPREYSQYLQAITDMVDTVNILQGQIDRGTYNDKKKDILEEIHNIECNIDYCQQQLYSLEEQWRFSNRRG